MCVQFFQTPNPFQLLRDIIRLVRDALAIANDMIHIDLLDSFIQLINTALGDEQNDVRFNPMM